MDDLFSYAARKAREREDARAPERMEPAPVDAAVGSDSDRPPVAPNAPPAPLTVSEINARARGLLEGTLGRVSVVGELSGCKLGRGGHWYFSLKDEQSQLSAVMFRREASRLKFDPKDGTEVIAHGRLTIYSAYGRYQLTIERLEPLGAGALQAAFEQLKERLREEGLFDPERKRALPLLPRRVAVVTSPTGAVIRDIIHVAQRRFPNADILLVPTAVQGADSAGSIARGLRRASRLAEAGEIDVVIVCRGGGSLEDLWGYNDERVARAIVESAAPVVSAVGHETDFTIADFAADVRAPTPSAAAELVFPLASELRRDLQRGLERGAQALRHRLARDRHRLDACRHRMGDAQGAVREYAQSLDLVRHRLDAAIRERLNEHRKRLDRAERALQPHHPKTRLQHLRAEMTRQHTRVHTALRAELRARLGRMEQLAARLHALSPLAVLERGYAIALDAEGKAVRRATSVEPGDRIDLRVHRGHIRAVVEEREDTEP